MSAKLELRNTILEMCTQEEQDSFTPVGQLIRILEKVKEQYNYFRINTNQGEINLSNANNIVREGSSEEKLFLHIDGVLVSTPIEELVELLKGLHITSAETIPENGKFNIGDYVFVNPESMINGPTYNIKMPSRIPKEARFFEVISYNPEIEIDKKYTNKTHSGVNIILKDISRGGLKILAKQEELEKIEFENDEQFNKKIREIAIKATVVSNALSDISSNRQIYSEAVQSAIQSYQKMNTALKALNNQTEKIQEIYNKFETTKEDLDKMDKVEYVEELDAVGQYKLITNNIYIEFDNYSINLGQFDVFIDIFKDILVSKKEEIPGEQHPHVSSDRHPCWGPHLNRLIKDGFGEYDVPLIVTFCIELLQSYNPDNPFVTITRYLENIDCSIYKDGELISLSKLKEDYQVSDSSDNEDYEDEDEDENENENEMNEAVSASIESRRRE